MNAFVDSYIASFQKNAESFQSTFGNLAPDLLNLKPNADSWSIAQIMEHLIITNESYYPLFGRIKASKNEVPWIGKLPFIPGVIGKMIADSLRPETKRKTKTFKIWEPQPSVIPDILTRFEKHHLSLIQEIKTMEPYFNKGIVISSPVNKYVVYSLDKAIEIMIVHEQRHYQQACEVLLRIKK